MIDLPWSLIIEATEDPGFYGFYSPELEGFAGAGQSVEDCIRKARHGMREHAQLLREESLPVPAVNPDPRITIRNSRGRSVA